MKAPCDVKGCTYVAEHPTKYVFAMLGNHKRHHHGVVGATAKYRQDKYRAAKSPVTTEEQPTAKPAKKPSMGLNFCPCCGINLRAVRIAVDL